MKPLPLGAFLKEALVLKAHPAKTMRAWEQHLGIEEDGAEWLNWQIRCRKFFQNKKANLGENRYEMICKNITNAAGASLRY